MPRAAFLLLLCLPGSLTLKSAAYQCDTGTQTAIATDRPQVTSSSIVVPCGSLQFENGAEAVGDGGQQGFDLPETSVRYGITTRTEARLSVPNYLYNSATSSGFASGFGDLTFGFKQQLGPTLGKFDVSVIPQVSLPTGADRLSSHGYDPSLQLPWSHAIGEKWTAAGMFSVLWPTKAGRHNLTGQASFYIDRQLLQPLDAYVEYAGEFAKDGSPQHSIDFGAAYKISTYQQVDFHCGFGLSAAATDWTIGAGYSFRLQVHRSSR
jgi:hypothetical protein